MREARGPAWTDWLHERGIVALIGPRHALARPQAARRRRDARRGRRRRRRPVDEALARRARAAGDGGRALVARRLDDGAVRLLRRRATSRVAVVDYGVKRSILAPARSRGRGGHRLPARRRRRTSSPATTASCSPTAPAIPSRSATRSQRSASCSAACRCSASASATSCSRSPPGMKTYKLPFGHRGANHPVLERATGRVLVTTQNHGFAVEPSEEREATHVSLYDGTVEGLDFPRSCARARRSSIPRRGRARTMRWPIIARVRRGLARCLGATTSQSVCLIGSGPIVIGQACEFDYAGSQALKVLREDGFRTIVVNSNPATIMTDPGFADRTYLEPLDLEGVARRARARAARRAAADDGRPDGAQPRHASLREAGVLDELGIELIGAGLDAIQRAEDRELFRDGGAVGRPPGARVDDRALARRARRRRAARGRPARVHARRPRRRLRLHARRSSAPRSRRGCARVADRPGARRGVRPRLGRVRARGRPRPRSTTS